MKESKLRLILLYSSSFTLLVITAILYYINVHLGIGPEFEFDEILSFVALVPSVHVISSVIFDIRIRKVNSSVKNISASNIFLPLFIV
jgi:hypothetical protein